MPFDDDITEEANTSDFGKFATKLVFFIHSRTSKTILMSFKTLFLLKLTEI